MVRTGSAHTGALAKALEVGILPAQTCGACAALAYASNARGGVMLLQLVCMPSIFMRSKADNDR